MRLLLFCATTYALAPVSGFGWLLATMGLAQCRRTQRALRGAYLAVFILIVLVWFYALAIILLAGAVVNELRFERLRDE